MAGTLVFASSTVPYQANVYAMKVLGVTDIFSISPVAVYAQIKVSEFVIVDQFIDRTFARKKTFFDGVAWHMSVAHPVCQFGRMAKTGNGST